MVTRIKICGLTNDADARAAIECGAHALGFVREPSSPRCISERDFDWIAGLPPVALRVGVYGPFRDEPSLPVHAIQSVDGWGRDRIIAIRLGPETRPGDIQLGACGAVVLDARSENAFGGTGQRVNMDLAREWVSAMSVPVILAGGLDAENVADAIRFVQPFGVDVSSGVESAPGKKDHAKLAAFCEAVRRA